MIRPGPTTIRRALTMSEIGRANIAAHIIAATDPIYSIPAQRVPRAPFRSRNPMAGPGIGTILGVIATIAAIIAWWCTAYIMVVG